MIRYADRMRAARRAEEPKRRSCNRCGHLRVGMSVFCAEHQAEFERFCESRPSLSEINRFCERVEEKGKR